MADDTPSPDGATPDTVPTQIDLYWRPGCGFCSMLQRKLDRLGIDRVEHNIWDDPGAAAIVRDHANGNETVPTVVVGDRGFVNPSARDLVMFLAEQHPHLLPEGVDVPGPNVASRFVDRVFG